MRTPGLAISLLLLLAALVAAPAPVEAASFTGLGPLPCGPQNRPGRTEGFGLSDDGATVVGTTQGTACSEAYAWTDSDGLTRLGHLAGAPAASLDSEARAASADGSFVVGTSDGATNREALRWTAGGGVVALGDLPGGSVNSVGTAVSADGSVVVGESSSAGGREAFRWTAAGMVGLGDLPGGGFFSSADDVSADGAVVVGRSNSAGIQAFRWTAEDGMVGLGTLGFAESNAFAVSPDGAVVVGVSPSFFDPDLLELYEEAFRWTAEDGMVGLGFLAGWQHSLASDVSADGNVIVGQAYDNTGGSTAMIWDPLHGMRDLQDVLESVYGFDLTGWDLRDAAAITPDGLTIVGTGLHNGGREAWVATIPEPGTALLVSLGLAALGARARRAGRER